MKSIIKVYGSYVQYNTRDFLYNLLYSSMHCVVLLLENMNSYFEVAYFSFVMYYGYIPYSRLVYLGKLYVGADIEIVVIKTLNPFYFAILSVLIMVYLLAKAFTLHLPNYELFRVDPQFIFEYRQFLHFWKIKINNKTIKKKLSNYQKRLEKIKDLPTHIIGEITNFIEEHGIQSQLYFKTFVNQTQFPWGCEITHNSNSLYWNGGEVTKVIGGRQADALEVKVGWKIKSINGEKRKKRNKGFAVDVWKYDEYKETKIMFEDPFTHPIRYPLEFITSVLFKILIVFLIKLIHDILYYIIIRKIVFVYFLNPAWDQIMHPETMTCRYN